MYDRTRTCTYAFPATVPAGWLCCCWGVAHTGGLSVGVLMCQGVALIVQCVCMWALGVGSPLLLSLGG